jgi:hypothetical protein
MLQIALISFTGAVDTSMGVIWSRSAFQFGSTVLPESEHLGGLTCRLQAVVEVDCYKLVTTNIS